MLWEKITCVLRSAISYTPFLKKSQYGIDEPLNSILTKEKTPVKVVVANELQQQTATVSRVAATQDHEVALSEQQRESEPKKMDARSRTSSENGKKGGRPKVTSNSSLVKRGVGRPQIDYNYHALSFIDFNYRDDNGLCLLRYYRSGWYRHNGAVYVQVSKEDIEAEVCTYLKEHIKVSKNSTKNVLHCLISDDLCNISDNLAEPFRISEGKELSSYLAFRDGTLFDPEGYINKSNRAFYEASADNFITQTMAIPFPRLESYKTDLLDKVLCDWLPEEPDRRELQKFAGYILTPSLKYNRFAAFIGAAGTGKSSFGLLMRELLGSYSDVFEPEDLKEGCKRGKLVEKNLLVMEEVENYLPEGLFKGVTTEGDISYKPLYVNPLTGPKKAKIIFSSNELKLRDKSGAILDDRMLLFAFDTVQRKTDNQVLSIQKLLIKNEAEGVFFWALKGLKMLMEEGFKDTPVAKNWKQAFKETANPEVIYCQRHFTFESGGFVSNAAFEEEYKNCLLKVCKISKGDFKMALLRAFPSTVPGKVKKIKGKSTRGYAGISITHQKAS